MYTESEKNPKGSSPQGLTIKETLIWGKNTLKTLDTGPLDARLLLQYVLKVSPEFLLSYGERAITPQNLCHYKALLSRRRCGEPVSKILGTREFYGRCFRVNSKVLDPRPDSELLIEVVLKTFSDKNEPFTLLDLGTGSGCLLLTVLAECPLAQGLGVDISSDALEVAQSNAGDLGLENRTRFKKADFTDSHFWMALKDQQGAFNVIISNPPYIPSQEIPTLAPEVRLYDPLVALDGGPQGLRFYEHLAQNMGECLRAQGRMVLEVGKGQAPKVQKLFSSYATKIHKDLKGIERCVEIVVP